ncbi:hypothetical protein Kisp01_59590 [Kineosporia sp. NBRC 101677]|uniref:hypothetical protein n=1 Tax=Kineosporia sp. NBRC 101677 TaxID=3032197 RepID=UPI0024A4F7E7|nr:hypothetical protein [Kineosporia sp. NBRC 101677]GLY18945.1 hypothetical protein Kisp01_59590 [Kineosporia sp. NBRC 101677]
MMKRRAVLLVVLIVGAALAVVPTISPLFTARSDAPAKVGATSRPPVEPDQVMLTPGPGNLLSLIDLPVEAVRATGESTPVDLSGQRVEIGVCPTNEGSAVTDGPQPEHAWEQEWYDRTEAAISPGAYEQLYAWNAGPAPARQVFQAMLDEVPGCAADPSDDGDSPVRPVDVAGSNEPGAVEIPAFFTVRNHWRGDNEGVAFARLGNTVVMVRSLIPGNENQDAENAQNLRLLMDRALQRALGQDAEFRYVSTG